MKTKTTFQTILMLMILVIHQANASKAMSGIDISNASHITGRVNDSSTRQPMEYVTIALYQAKDSNMVAGTISNSKGEFTISMLDSGRYYLEVSYLGFEKKKIDPVLISGKLNKINLGEISLAPATADISEVLVTGNRSAVEYKVDKRVVNVEKNLSAQGGTAVNALENTPSVQVDAQGNVLLRGSKDYLVLIDGKPSVVKGSDALKQLQANTIKQIEVITNPSAKYDVDGNAGIINVIMKKEKLQGLSGNVSVSPGTPDQNSASALVNYKMKKLNVFAGFDYADRTYYSTVELNNVTFKPEGNWNMKSDIEQYSNSDNATFRTGLDFDPNEKNTISVSGSAGRQGYDKGNDALYTITENGTSSFVSKSFIDIAGDAVDLNADYTHRFADGHTLAFTNYWGFWNGYDENFLDEYKTSADPDELTTKLNYRKDNNNFQYRSNIDYTRPLKSGKLEAGGQFRYESRQEDLVFNEYNFATGDWVVNDDFSYKQDYRNTIVSGYAIYSGKLKTLNYQVGLRTEYFTRTIEIDTDDEPAEYTKFMVYPSIHLSKEFNEKHQLQANYSRRINRPQPWLLNNTPSYIDPYNIFMGNTDLKFEYSDNFELNYRTTIKQLTLSTQTYYRNTLNAFTALRIMDENGVMIHQLANAENQASLGIEQEANINVLKWLQLNANVNFYHFTMNTMVDDVLKKQQVNTWEARVTPGMNFKTGTRFQTTAYYRAPSVDAMGRTTGFFNLTAAANQSLLKGKLTIGLTAQNILNSIVFDYSVKTDDFDNLYKITNKGPVFIANITWNFNNYQNKKRGRADDTSFKGGGAF